MPHAFHRNPGTHLDVTYSFGTTHPYLLLSDYYSKFPLMRKLNNIWSDTAIAHLKSIFEEHGIPDKLVTGNDTQCHRQ